VYWKGANVSQECRSRIGIKYPLDKAKSGNHTQERIEIVRYPHWTRRCSLLGIFQAWHRGLSPSPEENRLRPREEEDKTSRPECRRPRHPQPLPLPL